MDPERFVVIHVNPNMAHQQETGLALADGFKAHRYRTLVTDDRSIMGGINVINGPNWAYRQFLGEPNVLMVDRAWWGDPEYVQIGWLKPDGGRDYGRVVYPERPTPPLAPMKATGVTGLLVDWGMHNIAQPLLDRVDKVRFHPTQVPGQGPLEDWLQDCRKVVGWRSTALVEAMLQGCELEILDRRSLLYGQSDRERLVRKMASNQWNRREISAGEFWHHLRRGVTKAPDVRYARPTH